MGLGFTCSRPDSALSERLLFRPAWLEAQLDSAQFVSWLGTRLDLAQDSTLG